MRSPLSYLLPITLPLTLIVILASTACTKSKPANATTGSGTASILGTWTWAFQSRSVWDRSSQPSLTPATSGISRTLIFDTTGKFTLIHNDSIFKDSVKYEPNYLHVTDPALLLPGPTTETDTGFYRVSFGIIGCAFTDTTTLTVQNVPYQALLSADTLLIHGNPCLSRVVDIYVRKN